VTRYFISASLLALAAPAFAQDVPAAEEIIVTAQRNNQTQVTQAGSVGILGDKSALDVPFSIKSYNEALILNQQPQTLGQVLENDPSVRITYGFGNAAEQFVIRGFAVYGDDVGLDGLYGIAPRQLVAPELYQSVQVLNGASAFLNGAAPGGSGIGGSVNLVLKKADRDLTRATVNYSSSSHFGGSFDLARRFDDGAFGVRLNGVFRSGDVAIDDEFRRVTTVGGAFDWRGADVRLSLDLAYSRVQVKHLRPKVTVATARIPAPPAADHNYGQAFTYTNLRDIFGTVRGEWDVADNAMVYAQFGARDGSEAGIYDGITVTNAVTGAANGNALYVPRTDNNEAAQAGIRVKLGSAITHEINFGGSYIWQVNRNAYDFRYGPGFAGYATNLYNTPQVALPSSTLVGGNLADPFPVSRTKLGSAFASDTIGLFDGRVMIIGGVRLQTLDQRSFSYVDGSAAGRYRKDAATPVAGLVVKPNEHISLFANRIESLQQGPTAPIGTAIDPATNTSKPIVNGGEVFAPYRSVQYEVGGKVQYGKVGGSLAFYTIALPVGVITSNPGNITFVRFGLDDEQRNRGVELTLNGELTKGLRLIAGGSIVDAKLRKTQSGVNAGNRAPGVPEYTANANVEWDVVPALTLTGRVVQTGKQMVNVTNTLELPSWTRFDLGARYVVAAGDKPITLRAGVDNVANKRYWASAFDTFSQALLQGTPRTYKASLSVDF
jgi:iron complex outermembrane receptor protein